MPVTDQQQMLLKQLPGVDTLMAALLESRNLKQCPKSVLLRAIRETLDKKRDAILGTSQENPDLDISVDSLIKKIAARIDELQSFNLERVINATGVVVHTNLGRSCLARQAIDQVAKIAGSYSNLEFDLKKGRRGSRYSAVEELICEISGAEAAMVVNNNAGAVLLSLDTLAHGTEVVISRGELVEIGGSFRVPDVMAKSGAVLREIGTTNRTHLRDYESAINDNTGLLLKVHTSNYSIVGFTASVPLKELVALGRTFNLPVMEDLGSGNFIDFSKYGLLAEPTVQDSVATGADVITFSGDKLLGGPQAGPYRRQKKDRRPHQSQSAHPSPENRQADPGRSGSNPAAIQGRSPGHRRHSHIAQIDFGPSRVGKKSPSACRCPECVEKQASDRVTSRPEFQSGRRLPSAARPAKSMCWNPPAGIYGKPTGIAPARLLSADHRKD